MTEPKETPPQPQPDCCEVWPKLALVFGWYNFANYPDLWCMPYITDRGGNQWRVNFCPSCGAPSRDRVMSVDRLE